MWIPQLSPNFEPRQELVQYVVLHAMNMPTTQDALNMLCDPQSKVSSHYVVDRDGTVYQLVSENCVAWHAGESAWGSEKNLNRNSIGIELIGEPHKPDGTYTEQQYSRLKVLLTSLKNRYGIEPHNVVGHSDIAPERKTDPGAGFEWFRLEQDGLVERPNFTEHTVYAELNDYGYQGSEAAVRRAVMRRLGIKPPISVLNP